MFKAKFATAKLSINHVKEYCVLCRDKMTGWTLSLCVHSLKGQCERVSWHGSQLTVKGVEWGLSSPGSGIVDTCWTPDPQQSQRLSFTFAHQPVVPHFELIQQTIPFQMYLPLPSNISYFSDHLQLSYEFVKFVSKSSHPKSWQPFPRGGVSQLKKCFLWSVIGSINGSAESFVHTVSSLFWQ